MDTQNQANPWRSDRSLGSVGHALQCAEATGALRKVFRSRPIQLQTYYGTFAVRLNRLDGRTAWPLHGRPVSCIDRRLHDRLRILHCKAHLTNVRICPNAQRI